MKMNIWNNNYVVIIPNIFKYELSISKCKKVILIAKSVLSNYTINQEMKTLIYSLVYLRVF